MNSQPRQGSAKTQVCATYPKDFISCIYWSMLVQRSAKRLVRGCEKFFPALAYLLNKICVLFSRSLYMTALFLPRSLRRICYESREGANECSPFASLAAAGIPESGGCKKK